LYNNNNNKNLIVGDSKDAVKWRTDKIVGGEDEVDKNDGHVGDLLANHLPSLITGDGDQIIVDQIVQVTKQVVSGVLYRVKGNYIVEGQKKLCTISLLERNWLETEKIIISAKCDDGSCYVTEFYTCSQKSLKFW
jgi:hypothetical protein